MKKELKITLTISEETVKELKKLIEETIQTNLQFKIFGNEIIGVLNKSDKDKIEYR
jgi:hypothetical protein